MIDSRDLLLEQMLQVQAERGGCVVALLEVPPEAVSLYGVVVAESTPQEGVVRITDLVEKPSLDDAPSNLAVIGRYALSPAIFPALRETQPGRGGEMQLTDALRAVAVAEEPMHGVLLRGRRYDTGDRGDYLRAVVRLACERPDIGPDFRRWLEDFVAGGG
jgi:UTP--glucose-1-phosphate uridylyltransferase